MRSKSVQIIRDGINKPHSTRSIGKFRLFVTKLGKFDPNQPFNYAE